MIGRTYLDPGSLAGGKFDPPRPVVVVVRWGPGGGPRNVLVRYLDYGHQAVIPFPRRLRRPRCATPDCDGDLTGRRPQTRYCSGRCRVRALRARRAQGTAAETVTGPEVATAGPDGSGVTVSPARGVGGGALWTELVADLLDGSGRRPA